ncbi:MAG: hypothetical protein LBU65_01435 [Planctomycetaceae bacterium]|jgi:hypothetical protein|nr:hypothetical protein [Planctomycetaceae bacterium]
MSALDYEVLVPKGGTIVLPPDFYGYKVLVTKKVSPLPENNDHWNTKKSLEQLAQEQGIEPLTDPDRIFGSLANFWKDKEDVEDFLRCNQEVNK